MASLAHSPPLMTPTRRLCETISECSLASSTLSGSVSPGNSVRNPCTLGALLRRTAQVRENDSALSVEQAVLYVVRLGGCGHAVTCAQKQSMGADIQVEDVIPAIAAFLDEDMTVRSVMGQPVSHAAAGADAVHSAGKAAQVLKPRLNWGACPD